MSATSPTVATSVDPVTDYVRPEDRAPIRIDERLTVSGWVVKDYRHTAVAAAQGVTVR